MPQQCNRQSSEHQHLSAGKLAVLSHIINYLLHSYKMRYKGITYPLFASMISPLKVQN